MPWLVEPNLGGHKEGKEGTIGLYYPIILGTSKINSKDCTKVLRMWEKYHKEMEIDLIRTQIEESREETMARFLHNLNKEIQDLVHQAIKVVLQFKRRNAFRKPYLSSSRWKDKEREKEKVMRDKSPKKGSDISYCRKETSPIPTFNGKGHIASQCPNKRTMVLRDNGEVESEKGGRDNMIRR
ncbi:hypothetical protein CR513_26297, partial [Mucuna pruriens]